MAPSLPPHLFPDREGPFTQYDLRQRLDTHLEVCSISKSAMDEISGRALHTRILDKIDDALYRLSCVIQGDNGRTWNMIGYGFIAHPRQDTPMTHDTANRASVPATISQ